MRRLEHAQIWIWIIGKHYPTVSLTRYRHRRTKYRTYKSAIFIYQAEIFQVKYSFSFLVFLRYFGFFFRKPFLYFHFFKYLSNVFFSFSIWCKSEIADNAVPWTLRYSMQRSWLEIKTNWVQDNNSCRLLFCINIARTLTLTIYWITSLWRYFWPTYHGYELCIST